MASNATEPAANEKVKDNVMLYPSGLIMGKAVHANKDRGVAAANILVYTKHYYIGSERISAKTGTVPDFGAYPQVLLNSKMNALSAVTGTYVRNPSGTTLGEANSTVSSIHSTFGGMTLTPAPASTSTTSEGDIVYPTTHTANMLNIYYFHPDHLGSSSYMTNRSGVVCQHMEYLPFGETLVDEHLNSNNSPFKFNGKEFDEETGNFYYGARYYDPKFSIFISVDPLVDQTFSAYGYCYNNPLNLIDPTGMSAEGQEDWYKDKSNTMQYDPKVKSQKDLGSKGTYVGETYKKKRVMEELLNIEKMEV